MLTERNKMKIKFEATIDNMSLKKDGEYRIQLRVSLQDVGSAISMIKLLDTDFMVGILAEDNKAVITKAYFYKLTIDREGESKIVISFPADSIMDNSLSFFGKHQEELVKIVIRDKEE